MGNELSAGVATPPAQGQQPPAAGPGTQGAAETGAPKAQPPQGGVTPRPGGSGETGKGEEGKGAGDHGNEDLTRRAQRLKELDDRITDRERKLAMIEESERKIAEMRQTASGDETDPNDVLGMVNKLVDARFEGQQKMNRAIEEGNWITERYRPLVEKYRDMISAAMKKDKSMAFQPSRLFFETVPAAEIAEFHENQEKARHAAASAAAAAVPQVPGSGIPHGAPVRFKSRREAVEAAVNAANRGE